MGKRKKKMDKQPKKHEIERDGERDIKSRKTI